MLFIIFLGIVTLIFILKNIYRSYEIDQLIVNLPTLPSKPIIGHLYLLAARNVNDIFRKFTDITFKFDTTFKLWFGPWLYVIVQDIDDLKIIFNSLELPNFYRFTSKFNHHRLSFDAGEIY